MCRTGCEVRRPGLCLVSRRTGRAKVVRSYSKQLAPQLLSGWLAEMGAEVDDGLLVRGLLTPQTGLPFEGYKIHAS